MKKRIFAIAVTISLLFSLSLTADAHGVLSSKYINYMMVQVSALGNSDMEVSVVVKATDIMDEVDISSLVIEEAKSSSGPWSVKKTWHCSGSAYYVNDSDKYTGSFSFTGTRGYYYRARIVGYAEQSSTQGDKAAADSYVTKCT